VLGLTLDDAKTYGLIGVAVIVVAALVAVWAMNTMIQKAAMFLLLGVLAFAVWTQRTALEDCADKVHENFALSEQVSTPEPSVVGAAAGTDDECSFFGATVTVPAPSAP
jgi:hypothetical protein